MKSTSLSLATIGFLMLCLGSNKVSAQAILKIGSNQHSIQPKAVLEIESTTKGFLPPRMTNAQMTAIGNIEGMIVWCTDCASTSGSKLMINDGSGWTGLLGYKLANGKLLVGNSSGIAEELTTSGVGSIILNDSPTLINPNLGTPSAGIATNLTGLPLTTGVTGILPIANGGTGSSSQNFVDLTSNQTVAGNKTFSADLKVNGLTVGKGSGSSQYNTAVGIDALNRNTNGDTNVAIGKSALYSNTTGSGNTGIGEGTLSTNTTGSNNAAFGANALKDLNILNGTGANTAIGYNTGRGIVTGTNNTILGAGVQGLDAALTNNIILSSGDGVIKARHNGTDWNFTGKVNATQFVGALTGNAATVTTNANLTGEVTSLGNVTTIAASPALTGTPTAPTPTLTDNSNQIATTAFVKSINNTNSNLTGPITSSGNTTAVASQTGTGSKFVMDTAPTLVNPVLGIATATSVNGTTIPSSKTLVVTTDKLNVLAATTSSELAAVISDETGTGTMVLSVSPALTGTPSAPTAASTDSSTQIATTAFVKAVASSSNFVDLTNAQTVAGIKTFTSNASFNGQSIGKGNATGADNLAVGSGAMNGVSTGSKNTALGAYAMQGYIGTGSDNNTSIGYNSMIALTSGSLNTSVGAESMTALLTGNSNTSVGNQSLMNTTGNSNVGIGKGAGTTITSGSNNTMIGTGANVGTNSLTNTSAIGYGATVLASNTIQLGNTSITDVKTSGTFTADAVTYPKAHGTPGQVLSTSGSGTLTWITASVIDESKEFSATASQTSFALTQTPSTNSKVKMFINGIRISNTAYTLSGSTLTYVPANNGSYNLALGDRVQIDFFR